MINEEEFEAKAKACKTQEELDALMKETGEAFRSEGLTELDPEMVELILSFCDAAVTTVLRSLGQALNHPDSPIGHMDGDMILAVAENPPPIVRQVLFGMIDSMGLTLGTPASADDFDTAVGAILDGGES